MTSKLQAVSEVSVIGSVVKYVECRVCKLGIIASGFQSVKAERF